MRDKVLDPYTRHPVASYVLALESELNRVKAERDGAWRMLDAVLVVDGGTGVSGVVGQVAAGAVDGTHVIIIVSSDDKAAGIYVGDCVLIDIVNQEIWDELNENEEERDE